LSDWLASQGFEKEEQEEEERRKKTLRLFGNFLVWYIPDALMHH